MTVVPCLAALILWASVANAQERIGQFTAFSGNVKITRADGKVTKSLQRVGGRIRNSTLYHGDKVETAGNSSAELLFKDGTVLRIEPSSKIGIDETKLASPVASAKPFMRTIDVMVGKVWSDIKPNNDVATQFQTPGGVAAVRGTIGSIEV